MNDSSLVWLVRLTSIVLIPYAFYSIYTGYLNGLKKFGTQAKLTVLYSIAKVVGVFAFVLVGLKVVGAIIGFAMAPLLVFYLNRFLGIKIDIISVSMTIALVAVAGALAYFYRIDKFPAVKKHADNVRKKLHRTKE